MVRLIIIGIFLLTIKTMIPIKINEKSYQIKTIKDLTTREFIDLLTIEKLDLLKYITWQTGLTFEQTFYANVSKKVEDHIGKVPNIETLVPNWKMFNKSKTIETVGQRHQIESCGLTGYPLLVFALAVSQLRSNNIDEVYKERDRYMDLSFLDVLPTGVFFFNRLTNGSKPANVFLAKVRQLIKTKLLKRKLELKN